ncbi:hypothetical protein [Candidatus Palauibacter sp.]|uniref:hypothetical protein n=1 Tax=Candidatus Palauibacter sp. TaxID=3101350 RepID=UPI003B5B1178
MIVPSIDLMGGRSVQLRQGATLEIDAGDPRPLAERFAVGLEGLEGHARSAEHRLMSTVRAGSGPQVRLS